MIIMKMPRNVETKTDWEEMCDFLENQDKDRFINCKQLEIIWRKEDCANEDIKEDICRFYVWSYVA